jgi:LmbE family N-acetylglucosaminyl deacetylase
MASQGSNVTASSASVPRRALVLLAHPDDPEYFCGGTVAVWADAGAELTYCLVTSGEKGSDDLDVDGHELARRREAEQRAAAQVLGVRTVHFLGLPDGMLEPDLDLRREMARAIRRFQPDIVVTCDPTMLFTLGRGLNHPDHRAVGLATLDAVYPAAGSGPFFPELLTEGLTPHKVSRVFLAGTQNPDTTVDISSTLERKLEALRCHRSQIRDFDEVADWVRRRYLDPTAPDSPRYLERVRVLQPFDD